MVQSELHNFITTRRATCVPSFVARVSVQLMPRMAGLCHVFTYIVPDISFTSILGLVKY